MNMAAQPTIKQAGGWAAWCKLTGWVDPKAARSQRTYVTPESFGKGSYAAAVRYYSRFRYRP
jgi:hypothetical protein